MFKLRSKLFGVVASTQELIPFVVIGLKTCFSQGFCLRPEKRISGVVAQIIQGFSPSTSDMPMATASPASSNARRFGNPVPSEVKECSPHFFRATSRRHVSALPANFRVAQSAQNHASHVGRGFSLRRSFIGFRSDWAFFLTFMGWQSYRIECSQQSEHEFD